MVAKPRNNFFEPWEARIARGYEESLDIIPGEILESLEEAREKSLARRPWVIWGSGMVEPCVAKTMHGQDAAMDDKGIIVKIYPNTAIEGPRHDELAKRICVCVNACKDLLDPGKMADRWTAIELENNELRDEVTWLRLQLDQLQEGAWDGW